MKKLNRFRHFMQLSLLLLALSACGGEGGGEGGSSPAPVPEPSSVVLVPFKISLASESGLPVTFIDESLIGSHSVTKIIFTNPNSLTVQPPIGLSSDIIWIYYQAQANNMTYEAYRKQNIVNSLSNYFIKTTNSDDCFNTTSLVQGASCAFYSFNTNGMNYSSKSTSSTPIAYTIRTPDYKYSLNVQQCTYHYGVYNCSNASKPGFSDQFITFKSLPINGITNVAQPTPTSTQAYSFSGDGTWALSCDNNGTYPMNCSKYSLNYDINSNSLTQSSNPSTSYSVVTSNVQGVYPMPDGSSWIVGAGSFQYNLVNTNNPNQIFDNDSQVPGITSSPFNYARIGLDGSFWWANDIYDSGTNVFIKTNIPGGVIGVTPDGTVLGYDATPKLNCWKKGSGYNSYTPTPVANFTPNPRKNYPESIAGSVYLYMQVPNLYTNNGQLVTNDTEVVPVFAYFKVHTENNKCEVQLDDYAVVLPKSDLWTLGDNLSTPSLYSVAPISNVYLGK